MRTEQEFVPDSETEQLAELYRILQLGAPQLRGADGAEMALPVSAYRALKEVARNMQMGRAVSVISEDEQLSTQTAAELLGCSRPHVIKLLDAGEMAFEMVGTHRRIRYADLMAYKQRLAERREGWNDFVREAVREGYYLGVPLEEGQSDE